jgi:small subunit ribosomal protein S5
MYNNELKDKLVSINRITKVVKGGRRFAFAALVVVGNQSGSVGVGQAKSKQIRIDYQQLQEPQRQISFRP